MRTKAVSIGFLAFLLAVAGAAARVPRPHTAKVP